MRIKKKITTMLLSIITISSLFCLSNVTYATEIEESNNTSYSSNSTVTFVYSLSVEVRYVDENGNPLKEKKVIDGDEEKQFHITEEKIDGYELINTIGNPNGKFGEDFEVTFVYKKVNQNSNNDNDGNNQNNQNNGNNNNNNHNNDGNGGNTNNNNNNGNSNNSNNDSSNNNSNGNSNTNNSTNSNNKNQSNNITQNKQQSSNNNQIIDGVKTGDYYSIIIATISIGILLTISGLIVLLKMKKKH